MRIKIMRAMLIATVWVMSVADARAEDIVAIIAGGANLSTLASAIAAAGMTDMLKAPGRSLCSRRPTTSDRRDECERVQEKSGRVFGGGPICFRP